MIKYKIVGIINILLGIPQLLISAVLLLLVIPRLSSLYSDFGVDSGQNLTGSYFVILGILLIAAMNLFLGVKNLTSTKNKDKYFKLGIILAVISLFLTGILVAVMNVSALLPIYSLTTQF